MSKFMRVALGIMFYTNIIMINIFSTTYEMNNITGLNLILLIGIMYIIDFVLYKIFKKINDKIWNRITRDILKNCFK